MRKLLGLLVLLLSASTAPTVLAAGPNGCDKGDALMGPNCVHTRMVNVRGMNYVFSTLYRFEDGAKTIVWDDQGEVQESKSSHIVVSQLVEEDDGVWGWGSVRYNWSVKLHCYARRGGCFLK